MLDLVFNMILLGADVIAIHLARKQPLRAAIWSAVASMGMIVLFYLMYPRGIFFIMRLACYPLFLHGPILLAAGAVILRKRSTVAAAGMASISLGLAGVGVDAFLVEPLNLEISFHTLSTSKLERKIRVVVLSDIQIDTVSDFTRSALKRALELQPDLILMPGDYLQTERENLPALRQEFQTLLGELQFRAPLGIFAVKGNVDWKDDWRQTFAAFPVTTFEQTGTSKLLELEVTGLSFADSFNTHLKIAPVSPFHIVFGHGPDFALGDIQADLLIAGHTHGGQVVLPFIGPILTLSKVPRSWASGVTLLDSQRTLIVSRGIGMERDQAPRLRFLCRPEVVVVDLVPK